jgi:hypothetical protein
MAPQRPAETTYQAIYLTCPRCGLAVLKGGPENGSPFCPDCREADDVVVRMDLVTVPTPPGPRPATGDGAGGLRE